MGKYLKSVFVFLIIFGFASCIQQDEPNMQEENLLESKTPIRSIEDAKRIAGLFTNKTISRGGDNVIVIRSNQSRGVHADTLMYVVENDADEGFTVIAAPLNVSPLIALVEEGDYLSAATYHNEGFQAYMRAAENYLSTLSINPNPPTPPTPDIPIDIKPCLIVDTVIYKTKITPRVEVKWNQRWPENMFCSNGYCGCGPLAIAQILTHFKTPTYFRLTFDDRPYTNLTIIWEELKKHKKSSNSYTSCVNNSSCSATDATHIKIGALCRHLGVLTDAQYYPGTQGTAILDEAGISCLKTLLNGKQFTTGTSPTSLLTELKKDCCVAFVCGYGTSDGKDANHAFVADGCIEYGVEYIERTYNSELKMYMETSRTGNVDRCLHFNWGWGGNCNGYYNIYVYDTNKPYSYDEEFNIPYYKYNTLKYLTIR